jgi:hypothetical protein
MALGDYMGAQCHACIGGTSVREDMHTLDVGQHIVVGTPGRLFDMISSSVTDPDPLGSVPFCRIRIRMFPNGSGSFPCYRI